MMSKISDKGQLQTRYTNHSLRATSTSRLFEKHVPEKVIQSKSGHRSLSGLRAYENVSVQQERNVTKILQLEDACFNDRTVTQTNQSSSDSMSSFTKPQQGNHGNPQVRIPPVSGTYTDCVFNFYAATNK